MKEKISNILKYNKIAYNLYYLIMGLIINFFKIFIKTDDHLIMFNSFAGRSFNDSPKAIFEYMSKDPRFSDYHFIWAFHEPNKYNVIGATKIKTDSINYFKKAIQARVWITNSSVERGLSFKRNNTLYFNTWHGTPMKKMGIDLDEGNESFGRNTKMKFDVMLSQSSFETKIFSRCFNIPIDNFLDRKSVV